MQWMTVYIYVYCRKAAEGVNDDILAGGKSVCVGGWVGGCMGVCVYECGCGCMGVRGVCVGVWVCGCLV